MLDDILAVFIAIATVMLFMTMILAVVYAGYMFAIILVVVVSVFVLFHIVKKDPRK